MKFDEDEESKNLLDKAGDKNLASPESKSQAKTPEISAMKLKKKMTIENMFKTTDNKLTKDMEMGLNIKVLLQKQLSKAQQQE